jgi:hypothetical protein
VELVHVRLTAADLVGDSRVVVHHARTGLHRTLLVGDELVVTDQDGEFHGATVVAVEGDGIDPAYQLRVGARLPVDFAAERMTDADLEDENAGLHDVLDLLGELRAMFRQSDTV